MGSKPDQLPNICYLKKSWRGVCTQVSLTFRMCALIAFVAVVAERNLEEAIASALMTKAKKWTWLSGLLCCSWYRGDGSRSVSSSPLPKPPWLFSRVTLIKSMLVLLGGFLGGNWKIQRYFHINE